MLSLAVAKLAATDCVNPAKNRSQHVATVLRYWSQKTKNSVKLFKPKTFVLVIVGARILVGKTIIFEQTVCHVALGNAEYCGFQKVYSVHRSAGKFQTGNGSNFSYPSPAPRCTLPFQYGIVEQKKTNLKFY